MRNEGSEDVRQSHRRKRPKDRTASGVHSAYNSVLMTAPPARSEFRGDFLALELSRIGPAGAGTRHWQEKVLKSTFISQNIPIVAWTRSQVRL